MRVEIANRCRGRKVDTHALTQSGMAALKALGYTSHSDIAFDVLLVSDRRIKALHKSYFNDPTPTNVISFPTEERLPSRKARGHLGDIVISVDTAQRDAAEAGQPLEGELRFLMVHGLLHLLGHDHVLPGARGKRMREAMERWEERLMAAIDGTVA